VFVGVEQVVFAGRFGVFEVFDWVFVEGGFVCVVVDEEGAVEIEWAKGWGVEGWGVVLRGRVDDVGPFEVWYVGFIPVPTLVGKCHFFPGKQVGFGGLHKCIEGGPLERGLERLVGIEPTHWGVAVPCLTTWPKALLLAYFLVPFFWRDVRISVATSVRKSG